LKLKIYKPKNKNLQNYIDCFYLLQRNSRDEDIKYIGFPSNIIYLTICKDADVLINEYDLTIKNSLNAQIKSLLIIDNLKQGSTSYQGATNEITIYFKPLGINAFLKKPLSNYIMNTISEINPFEDYTSAINDAFSIIDDADKIEFLENYFITKFNHFKHPFLHKAIEVITNENAPKRSIAELSECFNISRVTLHKQFLMHIGTSPSQFAKIERFRNSIKMFAKHATKEQLVDIAYLAEYFDQSHMSKDFKSLTGYSPKIFFSKLNQIENNQIHWIFS
jgi:AraC-like DNA-binding protein